jgi:hypothetical protein
VYASIDAIKVATICLILPNLNLKSFFFNNFSAKLNTCSTIGNNKHADQSSNELLAICAWLSERNSPSNQSSLPAFPLLTQSILRTVTLRRPTPT